MQAKSGCHLKSISEVLSFPNPLLSVVTLTSPRVNETSAYRRFVDSTPSFPDISPRLDGLSDNDLRLLNDISRRALDSLG